MQHRSRSFIARGEKDKTSDFRCHLQASVLVPAIAANVVRSSAGGRRVLRLGPRHMFERNPALSLWWLKGISDRHIPRWRRKASIRARTPCLLSADYRPKSAGGLGRRL